MANETSTDTVIVPTTADGVPLALGMKVYYVGPASTGGATEWTVKSVYDDGTARAMCTCHGKVETVEHRHLPFMFSTKQMAESRRTELLSAAGRDGARKA